MFTIDVEEQFNKPNTILRVEITTAKKRPAADHEQNAEITEGMIKYALEQALNMLTCKEQ